MQEYKLPRYFILRNQSVAIYTVRWGLCHLWWYYSKAPDPYLVVHNLRILKPTLWNDGAELQVFRANNRFNQLFNFGSCYEPRTLRVHFTEHCITCSCCSLRIQWKFWERRPCTVHGFMLWCREYFLNCLVWVVSLGNVPEVFLVKIGWISVKLDLMSNWR